MEAEEHVREYAPLEPPGKPVVKPVTCGWAICGLIGALLCVPLVPLVCGAVALGKIRGSPGSIVGKKMALAALWLGWLEVVALALAVGSLIVLRAKRIADRTQACGNLKALGCLLFEFDQDWGSFPSTEIYDKNLDNFDEGFTNHNKGSSLSLRKDDSANFYLGMLITGGYTMSEEIMFAVGPATKDIYPDNLTRPYGKVLEKGECGFGYVMLHGGQAMSTADNPDRPLLVTPLTLHGGGTDPRFDTASMNGEAVVLFLDQSVSTLEIDKRSHRINPVGIHHRTSMGGTGNRIPIGKGSRPFDTGPGTAWGNDAPEVKEPR